MLILGKVLAFFLVAMNQLAVAPQKHHTINHHFTPVALGGEFVSTGALL
jgi:hypothetical protein